MKLTDLFASILPEDGEGRLDGSGGPGGSQGDTGEGEDAQQGVYASLTAAMAEDSVRMVHPDELKTFRFPDYPQAKTLPALVRHFKKTTPEYYAKIKADVQQNGFSTPALARYTDPRGKALKKPELMEGHHRAAVAHELGIPLPVGNYDNQADHDRSRAGNIEWFKHNERPQAGISWEARKTASEHHIGETDYEPDDGYYKGLWDRWHPMLKPTIHRAVGVKIPADHPVHDESLPVHERAHALLDTVAKGDRGNGRVGYHWTDEPKYAENHLKGDRYTPGETPVILHAKTPPRHHIEDNEYELKEKRAVFDWDTDEKEVPLKTNAPVHVTGISWPHRGKMIHHTFDEPVTKRALRTTATLPRPELPYEQAQALDHPDFGEYRRRSLEVAKKAAPGTHVWRSEHRPEADPVAGARNTGVGMHWTTNPDAIVGGTPPEGHHAVVWHGELDHDAQPIPRDHAMWQGRHHSMDSEAEVRLQPGSRVKLHGAYVWEGHGEPQGHPAVRNPENTPEGWHYHPVAEHAEVSGPQGHIDYSDVMGGHAGPAAPKHSMPREVAEHELADGNFYQRHQEHDPYEDVDWDGPDWESHSNAIMTNDVLRAGDTQPHEHSDQDMHDWLAHHPDRAGIEARHGMRAVASVGNAHGQELRSPFLAKHGRTVTVDTEGYGNAEMVPTHEIAQYASQPTDPDHAREVARHVLETGKITPLIMEYHPQSGQAYLGEGNHRLRMAKAMGVTHMPVRVLRRGYGLSADGAAVPQDHPAHTAGEHVPADIRPSDLGIGTNHTEGPRHVTAQRLTLTALFTTAADDEPLPELKRAQEPEFQTDKTLVHRGMNVVLPPHVHNFVHDHSQPQAARAHMLLSELSKKTGDITTETERSGLQGGTGGLGEFWSPSHTKAREFASQSGHKAYWGHEREHNCGDEFDGTGGCRTTHVVVSSPEPSEKHHWQEAMQPGEKYDRDISWRLPVKPGTKMPVHEMSWTEGDEHKSSEEAFQGRKKHGEFSGGQYIPTMRDHYDFASPVHKRASTGGRAQKTMRTESADDGKESHGEPPTGLRGEDFHGHPVEYTATDGWNHLDGSIGEGPTTAVDNFPVYVHDHVWLPHGRYWGPNSAEVDQRLFDGWKLRPEVRQDILDRIDDVWQSQYPDWREWAKVYFAGSQAAQWTDPQGEGNGDFDVLIGINWPVFHQAHPEVAGTDADNASEMTDRLWHHANISDYMFHLDDGEEVGPFDRTFFVNPDAWDIRRLHPYAAYDVTSDTWAVKPIKVPADWSASRLPESYWVYAESLADEIDAIGTLPPEERHRMAANLWEELHSHRSDAFADGGKGLFDLSNIVEKYLDQRPDKPWARLVAWKNQSPSGAEPWVPTIARRSMSTTAEVRTEIRDPQSGADYEGVMIALVPPDEVCQALAVEKGEPTASMHITLAYLGGKEEYTPTELAALPGLVRDWAAVHKPLTSKVGGVGTFVHPSKHVLWAALDIPHSTTFRDDLVGYLEKHGYKIRHDHGWTPHITLAYGNTHFRFMPKVEQHEWSDQQVWCCIGGRWESFDLRG